VISYAEDKKVEKYKGIIIEESLEDNRILNKLEIIKFRITAQENPAENQLDFPID